MRVALNKENSLGLWDSSSFHHLPIIPSHHHQRQNNRSTSLAQPRPLAATTTVRNLKTNHEGASSVSTTWKHLHPCAQSVSRYIRYLNWSLLYFVFKTEIFVLNLFDRKFAGGNTVRWRDPRGVTHNYLFSWENAATRGQELEWGSAQATCRQYCMNLVSIETPGENNFIKVCIHFLNWTYLSIQID